MSINIKQNICLIKKIKNEFMICFFYLMNHITIINMINSILTNEIYESKYSNITLKINKIGKRNIISSDFFYFDLIVMVEINGINQSKISDKYDFNTTENIVKLIWKNELISTQKLFRSCRYITEIDLSHFDTSKVTDMYQMFYGCSSLTSLDLTHFDTSQVTNMNQMFCECSSLTSLDLTHFDTSQVIDMNGIFDE